MSLAAEQQLRDLRRRFRVDFRRSQFGWECLLDRRIFGLAPTVQGALREAYAWWARSQGWVSRR